MIVAYRRKKGGHWVVQDFAGSSGELLRRPLQSRLLLYLLHAPSTESQLNETAAFASILQA
jgi:hypothetical protein